MSYEISFEQKSYYLHVTVTGENNKENVLAYLADVRKECTKRKCSRILVEEHFEGPRLEVMDVFAIASEGSADALGEFDAFAFVDVYAGELMEFAETVAVNRGIPIAVFKSVEDARQWLRHQKSRDDDQHNFGHGNTH